MYNSNRNTIWKKKETQYVWYALMSYKDNDMTET